jgi:hypothetical protein
LSQQLQHLRHLVWITELLPPAQSLQQIFLSLDDIRLAAFFCVTDDLNFVDFLSNPSEYPECFVPIKRDIGIQRNKALMLIVFTFIFTFLFSSLPKK